jgi:phosphoglycerol transferase
VAEPNYAASAAAFDSDAALVSSIAAAVGDDASIVQLPYRAFPESAPVNEVPDSDQLKPYLHSSTLSWTGGGIKGRPDSEWTRWLEELPAADLVQSAAAAGFEGILIDIQQYGSNTEVIEGVREQLGDPVISTPDGRYEFYDLTPALTAAEGRFSPSELSRVGEFITNPVLARLEPDPQRGLNVIDKTKPYRPQLLIENPRDTPVEIEVKFTVANSQGRSTLRFTGEDGSITEAVASATPRVITIPYTAPVGRSYIDISVISGLPLPQLVSPVIQMVEIDTKDLALLDLLDRG